MNALLVFAATFLTVFTLGLQSLNVTQGHYLAAIVTSSFISSGHILLYRYMPGAALGELAGYYAGGMAGISSSIWFHKRAKAWLAAWRERRRHTRLDVCTRCLKERHTEALCFRLDCPKNARYH